jgi:riboflavin synthase
MFTGIIQEVGEIVSVNSDGKSKRFLADLRSLVASGIQIGESIAINGACHTVEKLSGPIATFYSSPETLEKTNLVNLRIGTKVNLELSLTPSTRMGGHFVTGHIDGLAKLLSVAQDAGSYVLHFEIASNLSKYVIPKGSVALDGISLTVASKEKGSNVFSVAVIPHTWQNTALVSAKAGQLFNCEVDMLGKYVESLFSDQLSQQRV